MLHRDDKITIAQGLADQSGSWTPRKVIYTNGSMGTSRPYSVRAKRAFGAQMPPESIIQPLLSRTVASQRIRNPEWCQPGPSKLPSAGAALAAAWKLPASACPSSCTSSPERCARLRIALQEAKQQTRAANENARNAAEAKQTAEARMAWYKKREAKLLAARRKLESQNDQAMKAVSHAHEVVIALQKSITHKGRPRPAPGGEPAPREQDLQANLQSALAHVVDLQTQNKALLEQLKGANDEISDNMETEQALSGQLKKTQQQVEQAKLAAAGVANEVRQLQRSMMALTTTITDLLASNGESGDQEQTTMHAWKETSARLQMQEIHPDPLAAGELKDCCDMVRVVRDCMDCLYDLTTDR